MRLAQYVLLGAGGVRALTALGIEPGVIHLNEGHAALAPVQLAGQELRSGDPLADGSRGGARAHRVHDPHPGARRQRHLPVRAGGGGDRAACVSELGIDADEVIALGRTTPDGREEPFGVTQAALRMSRAANGVSRRHGQVAREMWQRAVARACRSTTSRSAT